MSGSRQDSWLVYLQFLVLVAIVGLADRPIVRMGLAAAAGLLLLQRALGTAGPPRGDERRTDPAVRDAVTTLLNRIREFYAACSLARRGQIPVEEAEARIRKIETELNGLLGQVIETTKAAEAAARQGG
jgi:hypothetical protein